MAIVASNGLNGPNGVQPTLGDLAGTGTPPDFLDNTGMLYSSAQVIRGRNSTRLRTNLTQSTASRFAWDMPSGPWAMRFYAYSPPMSGDFDINERRFLLGMGPQGLMMRESAARNIVTRLQDATLVNQNNPGTETGSAVAFDQLLRYEVMYDGAGTLTSRVFAGNDTVSFRQNEWSHTPTGTQLTLSGYRWYNYDVLESGDTDATTDGQVSDVQNQILVWDPGALPEFGADGDYGGETIAAVEAFQADMGLTVNGIAGAETRTALALYVRLDDDPNDYPDPVWVGNMTLTDTAEWIGPLDTSSTDLTVGVEFGVEVEAENTSVYVQTGVQFGVQVGQTNRSADATVEEAVAFGVEPVVTKAVTADAGTGVEFGVEIQHSAVSLIPDPPPLPPQFELLVIEPYGGVRGTLNHALSWSVSVPHNGVGTMNLTVSSKAPDAHLLTPPFEIALRVRPSDAEDYVEPPGCRFISLRRQRDLADRSGTYNWTLGNFGWILRKAKMEMTLGVPSTVAEQTFTDESVGYIMNELSIRSQVGTLLGITRSFDGSEDSNGDPWTDSQTIDLTYGTSFQSLVDQWTDQRIIDWRFQGRVWEMYRADDGMMRNMAPDLPVLSPNSGVLEATEIFSYEDFANRVLYIRPGEEGVQRTIRGSASVAQDNPGPWGVWNESLSLPGVTVGATATDMAADALEKLVDLRPQTTYRFPVVDNNYIPLYHFVTGDLIYVEDPAYLDEGLDHSRTVSTKQVHQISLTSDGGRFAEALVTTENRLLSRDAKASRYFRSQASSADSVWGNRAVIPFWQP